MSNHSGKPTALAMLAILPFAGFSAFAAAATQLVPLFDASAIKFTYSPPSMVGTTPYKTNTVDVFCDAPAKAAIRGIMKDGTTIGPPLVDNYMTVNNDLKNSVCKGGIPMEPGYTGSNCFNTGSSDAAYYGMAIDDVFTAPNVTAEIDLNAGFNPTTVRLWDWGGVLGNVKLVLELPDSCSTVNQWCSPGYWKNHPKAWDALNPAITMSTPYNGPTSYDAKKCARSDAPAKPTVFQVISFPQCYGGEAANAVADMLSDAHPGISFFGVRVEGSCPLN